MYVEYFQLREPPFSITPDPAYLYLSPRHQEALGHLLYGTGQYGGFVQLTGEVGTGKTTIIRSLLDQKLPDVDVAMIHNPRQSEQEFVQTICDELHVGYPRPISLKTLVDALNEHLLRSHAAGRRTVLIIDEAQNLQPAVLEQVRLLTNLETAKSKLLRIMLVGQPELSALLARAELRQLSSRISARYHLTPLSAQETREYIEHRLRIAGTRAEIFTPAAVELIHRQARGVPRLINIICDRALLGAFAGRMRKVTPAIARKAAREAIGELPLVFDPKAPIRWRWIETAWAVALLGCVALFWYSFTHEEPIFPTHSAARRPMPPPPPSEDATVVSQRSAAAADAPAPLLMPRLPTASLAELNRAAQPLGVVMGRLIRLWTPRPTLARGENICDALHNVALECYRSSGTWADLRQMDRPAILVLNLAGEGLQHLLLLELGRDHAVLDTVLGPMRLPIAELDRVWTHEFLLLWRRETHSIRIDDTTQGADIAWLQQRLVELGYLPPGETPSATLTPPLADAVRRLQSDRGLAVDGIAGVRTLIELGDELPDTPKLGLGLP
ncbi:AAA family ATPase [Fontimonas sp. SYSU GA230001]|uniref:ExeA family protein n=1 Tax=Fontimonas sp. SYSU GA230001 TaxID=3142450 RepID=UPI0032B40428